MFFKAFGFATPVLLGGLYVTGALGEGGWSRDVARPQAEVMHALENLDIRDQPGAPATEVSRSDGTPSVLKVEQTGTSMRWVMMNGNKVTLTMIADFEPIDGGKRTHVTAHVERGDAPDDLVAPAFRSKDIALGLFSAAIEGQLNDLTKPAYGDLARDPDACARLFRQFQEENLAASAKGRSDGSGSAIARGVATTVRLRAYDARQRQLGCGRPNGGSDIAPSEIAANDGPGTIASPENRTAQASTPSR
jgi:hypothetical protein